MIEHHTRRSSTAELYHGAHGTMEMLPVGVQPEVEGFIDRWNQHTYEHQFWQLDCGRVLDRIIGEARVILTQARVPVTDENLFNLFQIVTLNYAGSASVEPGMRKFMGIRRSVFRR